MTTQKWTEVDALEMAQRTEEGESLRSIADSFGITLGTARGVLTHFGYSWTPRRTSDGGQMGVWKILEVEPEPDPEPDPASSTRFTSYPAPLHGPEHPDEWRRWMTQSDWRQKNAAALKRTRDEHGAATDRAVEAWQERRRIAGPVAHQAQVLGCTVHELCAVLAAVADACVGGSLRSSHRRA